MRATKSVVIAALCAALLVGSSHPLRADAPAPTPAAFATALDQMKAHLAAGRAEQGLKLLRQTLETHARQTHAFAKRAELEDLARRLSFRCECAPPDPQVVVKGTLRKFTSKTGDLDIRYEAGKEHDFETTEDGDLIFPARFRGPFTVTIKGASYPATTKDSPVIYTGYEHDPKTDRVQKWVVYFGVAPYDEGSNSVWLPVKILAFDGEDKKVLYEKEISPATSKKPYRLDVAVTSARITAQLNGKTLGSGPKPDGMFGFARISVTGWSEIAISGTIEPSWIQRRVDAIVEGKRAEFEKSFDLHKVLPNWLYEAAPAPAAPSEGAPSEEPDTSEVPAAFATAIASAHAKLEGDDPAGALEVAESLRKDGAPPFWVAFIEAQAYLALDEATKALASVEAGLQAASGSFELLMLKAQVLFQLGREDEFMTTLRTATASPKAPKSVFEAAALFAMRAGRVDDARALVESASGRGMHSEALDRLGRVTVRAKNGPDWPKSYEFKSSNYHVVSDMDVETCKMAATLLEDALVAYRVHVKSLAPTTAATKLYRVYLFSGEAGFKRYLAESSFFGGKGMEHAAGIYSPILKQLLIWNLPTRDEMVETIKHEGFHQYLDRLLPDPPVWFNEGMATYYEAMTRVAGALKTDMPRPQYLEALKGKSLVPLARFLFIRPKDFYGSPELSYAQAWLLVHMLQHGTARHKELFRAYLAKLETSSGADATREVFDEATIKTLDADLDRYRDAFFEKK